MKILELEKTEDFQSLVEDKDVILFFRSEDCGVCQSMYLKTLEELKDRDLDLISIQIKDHKEISGQFLVFIAPTIVILEKGVETLRESKFINLDKIKKKISSLGY